MRTLTLLALCTLPFRAHASGAFVSGTRLEAVAEPGSTKVVFTVKPDTAYPVLKKGGPARAWCKLKGATSEGWVKCDGTAELPEKPHSPARHAA